MCVDSSVYFPQVKISTSSHTPRPRLKKTPPAIERERSPHYLVVNDSLYLLKAFNDHIPAVKIAGAVISPLDNIESVCDDLLQVVPDSCISSLMDRPNNTTHFHKMTTTASAAPIVPVSVASNADAMMMAASTTTTDESIPGVSTDESDEDSDLDEFLLDAALWLWKLLFRHGILSMFQGGLEKGLTVFTYYDTYTFSRVVAVGPKVVIVFRGNDPISVALCINGD